MDYSPNYSADVCLSVCLSRSRLERRRFSHLVQYGIKFEVLLVNCKYIQLSGYVLTLRSKGRWFDCRVNPFILPTFLYHETKSHTSSSVVEHWLWSPEVGGSTPKCISKRLEIFRISNFKNLL